MSPADERRRLVRQAQMYPVGDHEARPSEDAWFGGDSRPNVRSSLYPAEPAPTSPRRRAIAFAGVSLGLIAAALGVCWMISGSDATTAQTTAITSAPLAAPGTSKTVAVEALPNAPVSETAPVPTTVQPALTPAAAPQALAAAPTPVRALPAAAPRRAKPHDTLHVVMTPAPEPDEDDDSTSASSASTSPSDTREAPSE